MKSKINRFRLLVIWLLVIIWNLVLGAWNFVSCAEEVKQPNVAGQFYPDNPDELATTIDDYISQAKPKSMNGEIFALIVPHAGYGFSGPTAAYAYFMVKGKPYKTVIVIGTSHHYGFSGVSIYPQGAFRTPLGDVPVDQEFSAKLLGKDEEVYFEPLAFAKEHSVEVQLPFLQRVLSDFSAEGGPACGWKIVPVVMGDCTLETCKKFAQLLKEAIGKRKDVLVVVSSDLYHGYDYDEAEVVDNLTISYFKKMDAEGLYYGLREGKLQACGGFGVVTWLLLSKELGHNVLQELQQTNSAKVTNKMVKGVWTVGYVACAIDQEKKSASAVGKEEAMLNKKQRRKLLEIARSSIETYLQTGRKVELIESDPVFKKEMGAFVTLREQGELRGCIGNMIGNEPLYLTIRDMAVEAAVGDPRFDPVRPSEMKDVEIEISVLSPMELVDSAEKIVLGTHGVMIKKGLRSGVFLPQVATETGWSKEEFLSNLCAHKAGLVADAWKDKSCELYIFSAEVFSEKEY